VHQSARQGYTPSYEPAPAYSPPYVAPTPATPLQPRTAQPLFSTDTRASAPPSDGLPALSGRTKRFASIVRRVQIALLAQDFYSGAINGQVGPGLRSALRKFQKARGLDVTGTITPHPRRAHGCQRVIYAPTIPPRHGRS
jgi:peptidoglycan hydrolase-like protein with peptidoglycan-binding domain